MSLVKPSKSNRRRLAEALLRGESHLFLFIASVEGANPEVAAGLEELGAEIRFRSDEIDYLLAKVPIGAFDSVSEMDGIHSFEVDYWEIPPPNVRNPFDDGKDESDEVKDPPLPLTEPHLAIKDIDAVNFLEENPTFDGRGVGYALIDGPVDFLLPEFQKAIDIGGNEVPKVIDILTAASPLEGPESTWVQMNTEVRAADGVFRHEGEEYSAPQDGDFLLGFFDERRGHISMKDVNFDGNPEGSSGLFAVLWDFEKNIVWVDTDQNRDFRDERPLTDYAVNQDFGVFGNKESRDSEKREIVAFAIQTDKSARQVLIILGAGLHGTLVAGAAVGKGFNGGAYDGIAGSAQLVCVDRQFARSLHETVRALMVALDHPKVDVVCLEPWTWHADPVALILDRLAGRSNKPVFSPASNHARLDAIVNVSLNGNVITVGGYESRDNLGINMGAEVEDEDNLHPASSFGPGSNGLLQPDLLSPTNLISTNIGWSEPDLGRKRKGVYELPHGYSVSGGTSTAGPTAAAAAALLISAAKQTGVRWDAERLRHVLFSTARRLPGYPAYQQGRGVIQVGAAWNMLRELPADWAPLKIEAQAPVVTRDSEYFATPNMGCGIYEREGWELDQLGVRVITLTRTNGKPEPITLRCEWEGDTDSFSSPTNIELPLGVPTDLPVTVKTSQESRVYSAILHLRQPDQVGVAHSILNVVVAADRIGPENKYLLERSWILKRPGVEETFINIPEGCRSLHVEFQTDAPHTVRGWVMAPSPPFEGGLEMTHGSLMTPRATPGIKNFPRPQPGVTNLVMQSFGYIFEPDQQDSKPMNRTPVTLRASIVDVEPSESAWVVDRKQLEENPNTHVRFTNVGASFLAGCRGVLGSSFTAERSIAEGEQHFYELVVPEGTSTIYASVQPAGEADLPVYLYEIADGGPLEPEAAASPGAPAIKEKPSAGIWKVVVDGLRVPGGKIDYSYQDLIVHPLFGSIEVDETPQIRSSGETWEVEATLKAAAIPVGDRTLGGFVEVIEMAEPFEAPMMSIGPKVAVGTVALKVVSEIS